MYDWRDPLREEALQKTWNVGLVFAAAAAGDVWQSIFTGGSVLYMGPSLPGYAADFYIAYLGAEAMLSAERGSRIYERERSLRNSIVRSFEDRHPLRSPGRTRPSRS